MRTAIAVTPGFFESVADTAYRRTTHIVDMNRSAGHAGGKSPTAASVASFSARYLNAVRLGREAIERWSEAASPGEGAPSRCAQCTFVTECHATFGQVDGYGLYPFTERALWIGADRVDRSGSKRMNPRTIQNDLLVEVLDTFGPSLAAGEYPPPRLLEKLGGVKQLPLGAETELKRQNPHLAGRWMALLELYDGTGKVLSLAKPLLDALSVPPIPNAGDAATTAPVAASAAVGPPDGAPVPVTAASADDLAIQAWIRGSGLDATVAQKLRELIYTAVVDAVDWDMLGLSRTYFAGTGKAFQQRTGITFVRQTTQAATYAQVRLEIDASAQTGQALQGLLHASKDGFRWQFEGGDRALAAFLDCIERWAEQVVEQIQKCSAPSEAWSQVGAAFHLLSVGAAIGGRVKAEATVGDMIEAAFSSWPDEPAASASEMRAVYIKLLRRREDLVDIARSQASSLKGGRAGAMLDPRRALGPVRQVRRAKWRLGLKPPEADTGLLAKLYREVAEALPAAAAAERSQRLKWLEEMEEAFGEGASRPTIVSTLSAALKAALEAGVGAQNSIRPLQEALDVFQSVQFDATVVAVRTLAGEDDALSSLPEYGRGRANAVSAGTALRIAADQFLDAVERNLQSFGDDHNSRTSEVTKRLAELDEALGNIVGDLTAMEGSNAA
jgi:hypothetical protein